MASRRRALSASIKKSLKERGIEAHVKLGLGTASSWITVSLLNEKWASPLCDEIENLICVLAGREDWTDNKIMVTGHLPR